MSIKIKSINAKNLGPVTKLNWQLGNLNLVYGDNEKGKSYIVEFLIRSLFKTKKWTNLRDYDGSGKVEITGLGEKVNFFTPDDNQNLEDSLNQKYLGLPPDFSKLLVVRPTDIELGQEKESDKVMLRRFLSHKELLEKIEQDIQSSVKTSQITNFSITGDNRGKIKERNDLINQLEKINNLFDQIEEDYFASVLYQLRQQKEEWLEKYKKFSQAKRFKAFQLDRKIKKLEQKNNQIKTRLINHLISQTKAVKKEQDLIKQKERQLNQLKGQTAAFKWLESAIEIYQQFSLKAVSNIPKLLLSVGLIGGLLLTGTFFLIGLITAGIISLFIIGLVIVSFLFFQDRYFDNLAKKKELKKLNDGFEIRFDKSLNNLADLQAEKNNLEDNYNRRKYLEQELIKRKKDLNAEKIELLSQLRDMFNRDISLNQAIKVLNQEIKNKDQLAEQITEKKQQLASLQVDKQDYLDQDPEIEYDLEKIKELENKIQKTDELIRDRKQQLDNLKHQILAVVDKNASLSISELVEPLAEKREQVLAQYKKITAKIIAHKNIAQVIKKLYQQEDKKIDQVLNSPLVNKLLPQMTTRYIDLSLDGDQLVISDPYDSFLLADLSSGAKEQVFLSLRIALASSWFKNEKVFLILDDAFIHSDYHRKKELVKSVIDLSQDNWQIICLSFDDRIKKIFDQKSKDYNLLNLNNL